MESKAKKFLDEVNEEKELNFDKLVRSTNKAEKAHAIEGDDYVEGVGWLVETIKETANMLNAFPIKDKAFKKAVTGIAKSLAPLGKKLDDEVSKQINK